MSDGKRKWIIEGLHGASGQWIRFGKTEITLDENQAQSLTIDMIRDPGTFSTFLHVSYDPSKFDAFRAISPNLTPIEETKDVD